MRQTMFMLLPIVLVGLYLTDRYQYNGHYADVVWKQAMTPGKQFQDELSEWWLNR